MYEKFAMQVSKRFGNDDDCINLNKNMFTQTRCDFPYLRNAFLAHQDQFYYLYSCNGKFSDQFASVNYSLRIIRNYLGH